jgi:hypothetical protein
MSNTKPYTIISKWNKPGSRWVNTEKGGFREKTGKTMAMVIMEVNGKKVTRHIVI